MTNVNVKCGIRHTQIESIKNTKKHTSPSYTAYRTGLRKKQNFKTSTSCLTLRLRHCLAWQDKFHSTFFVWRICQDRLLLVIPDQGSRDFNSWGVQFARAWLALEAARICRACASLTLIAGSGPGFTLAVSKVLPTVPCATFGSGYGLEVLAYSWQILKAWSLKLSSYKVPWKLYKCVLHRSWTFTTHITMFLHSFEVYKMLPDFTNFHKVWTFYKVY